jgi:hypothetical protein
MAEESGPPTGGEWLRQVVTGYNAYHAMAADILALQTFRDCVIKLWQRSRPRLGQRDKKTRYGDLRGQISLSPSWFLNPNLLEDT